MGCCQVQNSLTSHELLAQTNHQNPPQSYKASVDHSQNFQNIKSPEEVETPQIQINGNPGGRFVNISQNLIIQNRASDGSVPQITVNVSEINQQPTNFLREGQHIYERTPSPQFNNNTNFLGVTQPDKRGASQMTSFQSECLLEDAKEANDGFTIQKNIFVRQNSDDIRLIYDIGELLGQGGFGKVYKVTHKNTQIIRAMKLISKEKLKKEEENKLLEETRILTQMDHPNIVKLLEVFQDHQNYYLVSEYCEGGELFDRIRKHQKLSEKQIAVHMKQILSAIFYCHKNGIIHRDLKPENILFDSKKSDACVKIIDFGASVQKEKNSGNLKRRIGTPFYVAPEVLSANYNEKCDIWSLGVILYIVLCGYPPFFGSSEIEILRKVKKGHYTMDWGDWRNISVQGKDIVRKMLEYNADKRISAWEAYNHPWIQNNNFQEPLNQISLQRLSDFQQKNKLKAAIYEFISVQVMTSQDKERMLRQFQQIDTNGDGMLSKTELYRAYVKIFKDKLKAHQTVNEVFHQMDTNGSGRVDYTEFVAAMLSKEYNLSKQKLEQSFKLFDLDGNGLITKEEISDLFGGVSINDKLWDDILQECDTDKDGMINQLEFVNLLSKKFKENMDAL